MRYSSIYAEYLFDQPSAFIILLGWSFYNFKSFKLNGLDNLFKKRRFSYLSNQVIY